jgi:hypothetical protein
MMKEASALQRAWFRGFSLCDEGAKASHEKEAEAPSRIHDATLPSRKTAGLVNPQESRMNAARLREAAIMLLSLRLYRGEEIKLRDSKDQKICEVT